MSDTSATVHILQEGQYEQNLQLIRAVQERPLLFDSSRAEYRDTEAKRKAWLKIQEITKIHSAGACKTKWKSLRDRYIREVRRIEKAARRQQETTVSWPYFESFRFYENCGRAPRTYARLSGKRRSAKKSEPSGSGHEGLPQDSECFPGNEGVLKPVLDPSVRSGPGTSRNGPAPSIRGAAQVPEIQDEPLDLSTKSSTSPGLVHAREHVPVVAAERPLLIPTGSNAVNGTPGCSYTPGRAWEGYFPSSQWPYIHFPVPLAHPFSLLSNPFYNGTVFPAGATWGVRPQEHVCLGDEDKFFPVAPVPALHWGLLRQPLTHVIKEKILD